MTENIRGKRGMVVNELVVIQVPKASSCGLRESDAWLGTTINRRQTARNNFLIAF
jgi:hypothetical protein